MLKKNLDRWLEKARKSREHRRVLTLPDYLLRDIGIEPGDLDAIARKPARK